MRLRFLAAVAAIAAAPPAAAHAQFAGVLRAPPRRAEAAPLTPTQVRAEQDSARREALSDMRAWVDSAAGIVTVTPRVPGAADPAPAAPAGTPPAQTTPATPPARPPE